MNRDLLVTSGMVLFFGLISVILSGAFYDVLKTDNGVTIFLLRIYSLASSAVVLVSMIAAVIAVIMDEDKPIKNKKKKKVKK